MDEPNFSIENRIRQNGYRFIAGVDEVGRGPLAGPVVAAAVILPDDLDPHVLAGVRDSKQLSELARERFYGMITRTAVGYAVAHATPREIEMMDIRKASLLAMQRAIACLSPAPGYVLVDGRDYPSVEIQGEAIVKGDQRCLTIGAASILAKVTRDRLMDSLHARYPQYGFDRHKGYPTQYHRDALLLFGPCDLHRKTFAHVPEPDYLPQSTPMFRELITRFKETISLQNVVELEEKLSSFSLSSMERDYLLHRIQYVKESHHRLQRRHRHSTVDRGKNQENLAIEYLMQKGYRLWEQNFHCREGEIDLVMNLDSTIVFVEVKSRTSSKFGMPYEAVTPAKRRKIIRSADHYLHERGLNEGWDVRYDIVSILAPKNQSPQIEHFEDAFRVEGELD